MTPGPQPAEATRAHMRVIDREYEAVMLELSKLARAPTYGEYLGTLGRLLSELCRLRHAVERTADAYGLPMAEAYPEVEHTLTGELSASQMAKFVHIVNDAGE